jgi:acyl carrier protein
VSAPPSFAEVARVIADVLGVDPAAIGPDASPDTIPAWDSVQHLNLVIALEEEFGARFTPEEIEEAVGVRALTTILERKARAG